MAVRTTSSWTSSIASPSRRRTGSSRRRCRRRSPTAGGPGPWLRIGAELRPRRWCEARGSQSASWTVSRNPVAEHDVDLGGHDLARAYQREQHDVDDAVGRLDLGPLVALEDVLDDERVERRGARRPARPGAGRRRSGRPRPTASGRRRARAARRGPSSPSISSALPLDDRGDADRAGARRTVGERRRATGSPARPVGRQRTRSGSGLPSAVSIRGLARPVGSSVAARRRPRRRGRAPAGPRRRHDAPRRRTARP